MIWREKRPLLVVLGGLLLINAIFFLTYRVRYEQRVRDLDARLSDTQQRLAAAQQQRAALERQMQQYKEIVSDIQTIYNDWWSTPEQRLTAVIRELRSLAAASKLQPKAFGYSLSDMKKEMAAQSLTISFSVQGEYRQVRQLINLIELSRQFMTIDAISISGGNKGPDQVNLTIQLRTIFKSEPEKEKT